MGDVASASELPAADVLPLRSVTLSIPFSFEQVAHIRDDGRRLAACAADRERALAAVLWTAPSPAEVLLQRLFVAVLQKPSTPDEVLAAVQNGVRV